MGAIQGSINNLLGTAAAGVALGKHAQEQKEAAIQEALDTKTKVGEEILEGGKQVEALEGEMTRVEKEEAALSDLKLKSDEDYDAYAELSEQVDLDRQKAAVALSMMKNKKKAIEMRNKRAEAVLKKAGLLGGKE